MKKAIILNILVVPILMALFAGQIYAQDKIITLKNQISSLDEQKTQLENERLLLLNKGEEISYKIEEQKRQSESGLGIFGRFALSQNLKKAQNLSNKIQDLDKKIYEIDNQTKEKRSLLGKEYEYQINLLLQQISKTDNIDEKKILLDKTRDYRNSLSQLKKFEQPSPNPIDIAKIEIQEHDSSKEIREKADLISDLAKKTNSRISILDSRIAKIRDELKTRKKLNEFAEEILFFGDKVARDEIATKSSKDTILATSNDGNSNVDTGSLTRYGSNPQTLEGTKSITQEQPQLTTKSVMKSNAVSAEISETPKSQLEEELKNLEKQKQELKKQLSTLNEKSNSFRKKADELEKIGENQATKPNKQNTKDNSQGAKDKSKNKP